MKNSDKLAVPDNTVILVTNETQYRDACTALNYKDMINAWNNNDYSCGTEIGIRINSCNFNPINYYKDLKCNIISYEEFKDKWFKYLDSIKTIYYIKSSPDCIVCCTEQVINEKEINKVMNEILNLVEILKDCPKNTELYSTIIGEVEFDEIVSTSEHPVKFKIKNYNSRYSVTSDGRANSAFNGECTLFPSKDQRDWSEFKVPVKYVDGNVYVSNDSMFLSNGETKNGYPCAYCGHSYNMFRKVSQNNIWTKEECILASPEQVTEFFKRMNYAGYYFNSETKELVKDLKIGTKVICADNAIFWNVRTYYGNRKTKEGRFLEIGWKYIVPVSKFDFDNLEANIENSI